MPVYEVSGPGGLTLELEGDAPPSESDLDSIFAEATKRTAKTEAPKEATPVKVPSNLESLGQMASDLATGARIIGTFGRAAGQDFFNRLVEGPAPSPEIARLKDIPQSEEQSNVEAAKRIASERVEPPPAEIPPALRPPPTELPIEQTIRAMPTIPRIISSAGGSLAESVPQLVAATVGGEVLAPLESAALLARIPAGLAKTIPGAVSAGLTFGYDESGKFQPKQAALMAALPIIGKYSGVIAETLASKAGVTKDVALDVVNRLGSVGGPAAALIADATPGILRLPAEQQRDAWINLASQAGQLALGLLGSERAKLPSDRTVELNTSTRLTEPLPKTPEVPSASRIQEAATIHGDVRPQPIEGVREVPVQESGRGVQPQAEAPVEAGREGVLLKPEAPAAETGPAAATTEAVKTPKEPEPLKGYRWVTVQKPDGTTYRVITDDRSVDYGRGPQINIAKPVMYRGEPSWSHGVTNPADKIIEAKPAAPAEPAKPVEPTPKPAEAATPKTRGIERPHDIIDEILSTVGKIANKKSSRPGTEGYYGERYRLASTTGAGREVFKAGGQTPDSVLDALRRNRVLPESATVDDLWDAIHAAAKSRTAAFKGELPEAKAGKFHDALAANFAKKRKQVINVGDLNVGDSFKLKGQEFEVSHIDPDTNEVTVKDGPKFGAQTIPDGADIAPDVGSVQKAFGEPFNVQRGTGEGKISIESLGWNTPHKGPVYRPITAAEAKEPKVLASILAQDARMGGAKRNVSESHKLVALQDNQTGEVHLVSAYPTGTGVLRVTDPVLVGKARPNKPIGSLLPRYTPIATVLKAEPTTGFHQKFGSLKEFEDQFGSPATERQRASITAAPAQRTEPTALAEREPLQDAEANAVHDWLQNPTETTAQAASAVKKLLTKTFEENPNLTGDQVREKVIDELHALAKANPQQADFTKAALARYGGEAGEVGEVAAIGKAGGKASGPGVLNALDSAAERARARLAQRRKSVTFGAGPFHELPNIADWAIIGASKLARGTYDVAKWSAEMVRELGDQIKPFLDQVYRHSLAMAGRMKATLEREQQGIGAVLAEGVDIRREEQAAYGAAVMQKIIKDAGSLDPKVWSDAMLQKFGDDIRSPEVLESLFKSARDEMSEGVPIPEPKARKPFTPRGTGSVTMSERAALANSLREREAASIAGRKSGEVAKAEELAPVIDDLREKLSNSVSKITALGQYFAGQERGAKIGTAQAKADAAMADRWLEADSNQIRDSLLKLVQGLPASERGRFLSAITGAMKRPKLFAGTVTVGGKVNPEKITAVENMYRKAAQVASRIENRIDEVRRSEKVAAIQDFKQWTDSPKIDVPYRQRIKSELEKFNRLEKAGGLSDDALQAAHDRLTSLRDIGRTEQATKEALWQWQKDFAETRLQSQPTRPVETRPELRAQPGEKTPLSMRIRNWLHNAQNKAAVLDKALLPIDALFDLMESAKGTYDGWLFRHARGPVDLAYNEATVRRNETLAPFDAYVKEHGLTAQNAERIGVFAQNMQEGGRQRLIDAGLKPETIDAIVKSLTPVEKRAYGIMREIMDRQLPKIQETMRKLYNTEVKPERNYFPMPRDWRVFEETPGAAKAPGIEAAYDELATWKALLEDLTPRATHSTKQGFTISRQAGAKTPIRIDAFDIFRQHVNDTSYLIEMQPVLKQMGELARGDLFRAKYGDVGQRIMLDWLDTVARQGGVENFKRWKLLDTIRKNTSVGIIGFRLASQVVHESNVPYIVARIGPKWFGQGMRETVTDRGQEFLRKNFAETAQRGGGEPAQVESEKEGVRIGGVQVVSPGVTRASYAIARQLDKFNSQASVLGTYLKLLRDKGEDWQRYDALPVDKEAQRMALILARRSIASPIAKDVPQALSRGKITGGNVSLGRSLFQFQNIFLDQWSNIRHDLWQAGIREKNPRQAAMMTLAILGAVILETGIKESSKAAISKVTGYQGKKIEDEFAKKAVTETVRRFPFGGQIESELQYGETGVPIIDATLLDIPKAIRQKNVIRSLGALGQVSGIPGSAQTAELVEKYYKAK